MQIIRNFAHGIFTVLRITGSPMLYRYPYRNSGEALRGDWMKISADIESTIGKLEKESHHE